MSKPTIVLNKEDIILDLLGKVSKYLSDDELKQFWNEKYISGKLAIVEKHVNVNIEF